MLIVNADDLGYDARTNEAILRSFDRQVCSSATLMANMPGFEQACELVHAHGLLDHVGIHLNLSEGIPLTDRIKKFSRLCDAEGRFRLMRQERIFWLTTEEQEALAAEIRAQIDRLRAMGLRITHLDSHKNIHEEWGIFRTILPIVRETGIPYIRLSRNIGNPSLFAKQTYRALLNTWLERLGLSRTRFFGSIRDFIEEYVRHPSIAASCEIMVHPGYDMQGELVDLFCKSRLDNVVRNYNIQRPAVSYSGHRYLGSPDLGLP